MTDTPSGKEVVQKTFTYINTMTGEARKGLMTEFNQKHKGIKFTLTSPTLRQSILDWFSHRDKNVKLTHEATNDGKLGEVRITFHGETKTVHFKVHVDALFTVTGQSVESPCYLKALNVSVDPRDFST